MCPVTERDPRTTAYFTSASNHTRGPQLTVPNGRITHLNFQVFDVKKLLSFFFTPEGAWVKLESGQCENVEHAWDRRETVRDVMAATRCSCSDVSIACHPQPRPWMMWPIWWPSVWRWTSDSSFSPFERTFHVSWRRSSSEKRGTLSRTTIWPCSATNRTKTAPRHSETRSPSPKADDHRILFLVMLMFYGIMVLIRKTTSVHAARCEVSIEVGSSPSLPSSVPHGIVLSVTTSDWLHRLLRAAQGKHLSLFRTPLKMTCQGASQCLDAEEAAHSSTKKGGPVSVLGDGPSLPGPRAVVVA